MNILAVCNENASEPTDYTDCETAKAVIVNDNDEVFLFNGSLPGGGVENGETYEQALARECMEEIGAVIEIVRELGSVITYRDSLKKKYIFTGYQCRLVSQTNPTTTINYEKGLPATWEKRIDAINHMKQYVLEVQTKGKEFYQGVRYQKHLFNTRAAIMFLEAIK